MVALIVTMFCGAMLAQSERARILGTVTDQRGDVLPGAAVTVINVATGVESKTVSDAQGHFQVAELPIGSYKLRVEHEGFKTTETNAYTLEINQPLRVDVKLPVGAKSDIIEVTDTAAQVETTSPTIGASITERPIVDLPLNGRNILSLATLEPAVMPHNPDDTSAGTFNIAGGRSDSVTFLLDGGVDNNLLSNGVVFTPNPDVVQEFRVLTSNYTAEYGRNAGGIITIVTKSGTNQLHGSAWEFNRNDTFKANDYFNNKNGIPKGELTRNQFGARVGGPFIKNKLFWSVSYQGQRQTAADTFQVSTFTPEMLAGNFSHAGPGGGPEPNVVSFLEANPFFQPNAALAAQGIIDPTRIDAVAKKYIAAGLIPTSASNVSCDSGGVCAGTFIGQANHPINNNEFSGKLDFNPTNVDHFTVTVGGRRQSETRPFQTGPGFPASYEPHNYFSTLNYTRTFGNNMINEFRATVQRNANKQAVPATAAPTPAQLGVGVTPDQATGPTRMGFEGGLLIGFSAQGPTALIDNTFVVSDTFSWTKGRHNWKFGGSYLPYQNNTLFDFFVDGQFDIDNFVGSFNQYANFLLGMPDDYFQFGSAPSNIRQKSTFFFAQDEWHVRRNLTLTLGVRYEYSTPKTDTQGRSFSVIPGAHSTVFVNAPSSLLFPGDAGAPTGANFPDKNDWAPRFGFAWDPWSDGKTSIRGGIGIFYDVLKGEDNLQFNGQAPFFGFTNPIFNDCSVPGCIYPTNFYGDPFGTTGTPNPFPSKPPAKNIDFGAAGFLPFGGGGVFFVNPHLRTPYVVQFNVSVEQELAKKLAFELGYIGSQGRKLTTLIDINAFDPATLHSTPHRMLNEVGGIDDFRFSFLDEFENAVNSSYNGLEAKLSKKSGETRFLGNTYFTLSYTWAHSIDNSSGFRNRTSQIPFFRRNAFRASSDFDIRQQLTFSGGWDLPFDRAWSNGPRRLTKGWALNPIVSWRTGFPLDVFANLPTRRSQPGPSGEGDGGLVYALLTGPITYFNPSKPTVGTTGNNFFDGSVFTDTGLAGCGCYGSGRGILRGPGRTNVDLAFAKTTKITENTAIEIRTEFFNLFNHAQFDNPDTNISSGTFGQVITTAPGRIIQFGARFSF